MVSYSTRTKPRSSVVRGAKLEACTIPNSVTTIAGRAFYRCTGLAGVYFQGNAPSLGDSYVFYGDDKATFYYLPGTTGWTSSFGGCPAVLWNPQVQTNGATFGYEPTDSASRLRAPLASPLWWKPAPFRQMQPGPHCKPAPSRTDQSISAIPAGRIILPVTTASARREHNIIAGVKP